jgi:hypothetical protein
MRAFAQKPKATQQTTPAKSTIPGRACFGQSREREVNSILHLQRTIGNRAVQRLLEANSEDVKRHDSSITEIACFGHDCSRIPTHSPTAGAIQTKLTINQPGDSYEQEADRVSEQVMRMREPRLQRACACGGGRPKCQMEQPGREHESLQTKRVQASDTGQIAAPPIVAEVLRSSGQPLDPSTREFMESRFGHDFSRVRVHTDARAAKSSRNLNALAYTVGEHIVLAPERYDHSTHAGRRLLAHELAHVVQQGGGACALQRQPQQSGAEELERDLLEMSHKLREIGVKIEEGREDIEIIRHQFFLAGKQMPKVTDPIDKSTVADFVEALIETSRTLTPFLPSGKRARTSVAKGLTIHEFREQFESEDARLSSRVTPSVGQPRRTKIVKGFYHRATDSIHLTTDTSQGADSKFGAALHEGIHKYSAPLLQTRLGVDINEGFTQRFADLVSAEHGIGVYTGHDYGPQMACAEKVIGWLNDGERLSASAYFLGNVYPLQQEIIRRLSVNNSQLNDLARDRQGEGLCERIKNAP